MDLTDWLLILAIALTAIAFYCARAVRRAKFIDHARHRHGTRLLIQGALALWTALLTLDRSFVSPGAVPFGLTLSADVVLAAALGLIVAGTLWSVRGCRLLRPRHLFSAS
jgi:fructose-specific phosphotransferase system IIC component